MAELSKFVIGFDMKSEFVEQLRREFPGVQFDVCTDRDQLPSAIVGAQAMVGRAVDAATLADNPQLRWIQTVGAGVDGILYPELIDSDVVITNNSGVHASNIAEHLIAMILAFARGLPELMRSQVAHTWQRPERGVFEISEQTLAVLGLGDIGQALAWRAHALGMRVIGMRRNPAEPLTGVDQLYGAEDWSTMLAEADHIAICLPLTERTRGLFGAAELQAMKSSAYIYNIGRGEIIDQDALITALQNDQIAGAGLDVTTPEPLPPESPLWDMPNVMVTCHTSGSTPLYWNRAIEILTKNIRHFMNDEPMVNVVDKREGY